MTTAETITSSYSTEIMANEMERALDTHAQFIADLCVAAPHIVNGLPNIKRTELLKEGTVNDLTVVPVGILCDTRTLDVLTTRRSEVGGLRFSYEQQTEEGLVLHGLRLWGIGNNFKFSGLGILRASSAQAKQEVRDAHAFRGPEQLPLSARHNLGRLMNPRSKSAFEPLTLTDSSPSDVLAGFAYRFYRQGNPQTDRDLFEPTLPDDQPRINWN